VTVVLVLEERFRRTPDGRIWASGPLRSSVWPRYLQVFDDLRVVARVRSVPAVPGDWEPAEAPNVSFAAVPSYIGPWQYARRARQVRSAIRRAVGSKDAVILRVPSQLSSILAPSLTARKHPFAVEVVGDPYDVFSPGAIRHPLRPALRLLFVRRLRQQCRHAMAALYVTEAALQRRYPCPGISVGISNVVLTAQHFRDVPRSIDSDGRPFRLVTVGTLEQLYKAPDVLISAVAACVRRQLDLQLTVVGGGQYRGLLERQARGLGIAERIRFLGHLSRPEDVRAVLDQSDLFVLPSRTEGLPRALIEAMARALPCIGSAVGGIPELLPADDLVQPDDISMLARKITEVLQDRARLQAMSSRNLKRSRDFREAVLQMRRRRWLAQVRDLMIDHLLRDAGRAQPRLTAAANVRRWLTLL
jgi:glycosyltransferase involved in cell wall biosynthesis